MERVRENVAWRQSEVFWRAVKEKVKSSLKQVMPEKMKRFRKDLPEAELRRFYVEERWTLEEIGEKFGVSQNTVWRRLIELGIPRRVEDSNLPDEKEKAGLAALTYSPENREVRVPSALLGLASEFGMGSGVSPALKARHPAHFASRY